MRISRHIREGNASEWRTSIEEAHAKVNSSLAKLSSSYEGKMASVERAMDAYGSELRTEMKDIRDKAGLSSRVRLKPGIGLRLRSRPKTSV